MTTCIYVFSGTGTSIAVARRIGDALGDTEIELIPHLMKKADGEIKTTAKRIGFIFPNFYGGLPDMVAEFIRRLCFQEVNYIFGIVTAGGNQGYSLKFLARELENKGEQLDYGKCIAGTSNYIIAWYYKYLSKKGEQRKLALQKSNELAESFASDIASHKHDVQKDSFIGYKISQLVSPKSDVGAEPPSLDLDYSINFNCIGCKICMKVCQFNNIKMKDGKPEFNHHCQRCMACLQYCPQNAIEYSGKELDGQKYNHPDYPAEVLIDYIANKMG